MKMNKLFTTLAIVSVVLMVGCSELNDTPSPSGMYPGGISTAQSSSVGALALANPLANLEVVNLGAAGNFAILSKSGITDVYKSSITGDVGTSPITGAALLVS